MGICNCTTLAMTTFLHRKKLNWPAKKSGRNPPQRGAHKCIIERRNVWKIPRRGANVWKFLGKGPEKATNDPIFRSKSKWLHQNRHYIILWASYRGVYGRKWNIFATYH